MKWYRKEKGLFGLLAKCDQYAEDYILENNTYVGEGFTLYKTSTEDNGSKTYNILGEFSTAIQAKDYAEQFDMQFTDELSY
jgi:hypothetical protein